MPSVLVLSSIYALVFRLPAVLAGRAREEHFLLGWFGCMTLLYAAGILVGLIFLEVEFALSLVVYLVFTWVLSITLIIPVVMALCGWNPMEYREFIDGFPRGWIESNVYSGVRDALREHEAERRRHCGSRR